MANTQLVDTPWLDILPPPAPMSHGEWLLLGISILIMMGLLTFYAYWRNRPRQRALRELTRLQQQLRQASLDHKQCLFSINRLLCLGFNQSQLRHIAPVRQSDKGQNFFRALSHQQYRAAKPDQQETERLLQVAIQLLKGQGR